MPEFRELGDMDIYTYDKHDEANQIPKSLGIDVEFDEKHDMFNFEGVNVEHHNTFINVHSKKTRLINEYLKEEG
ncbi:nucleotidyltransferase family protein [Bacteroides caccae]|uniref:nucleotidyltransferase family protein n=1 Tax=Bacteroides caccae TaxID=47678 RepID=UPI00210BDDA6|nr:nucleotidyltransferase family protein [Bacteroides caccae]